MVVVEEKEEAEDKEEEGEEGGGKEKAPPTKTQTYQIAIRRSAGDPAMNSPFIYTRMPMPSFGTS